MKGNKKRNRFGVIIVFITYLAGFRFPIDREWYDALQKPDWTPSGSAIGIISIVLFTLISLTAASVYVCESFLGDSAHQLIACSSRYDIDSYDLCR
ncbi:tryptophan-rich sensory protein [Bacillus sp. YC2]|nr:tryptophan-rich sensory protein [Bacillus sp. YC2]